MIYVSILLFILFIIWTILMFRGKLDKFDDKVYKSFNMSDFITRFLKFITFLGSVKFSLVLCLILLFINKYWAILAFFLVGSSSVLNLFLKMIFRIKRPNVKRLVKERYFSYPSGHITTAVSIYGFLIFLISISSLAIVLKVVFILLLLLLIIGVGISRIYLGVHYFKDIVGGFLIASSYLLLYLGIGIYFLKDFIF